MTALAAGARRLTPSFGAGLVLYKFDLPVKAGDWVKAGSLVVYNSDGTISPATTSTGLVVLGRAETDGNNTDTLDVPPVVRVVTGVFSWENSGTTDEITVAELGTIVYAVDDQTVAKTDGTGSRSPAGVCMGLDDDGKPMVATSPLLTPFL